jgi:tetratricopeptide (TPR) repeat protein
MKETPEPYSVPPMRSLRIAKVFTAVFPVTELVLFLLASSLNASCISAFNPAVTRANGGVQPAVINGSQSDSGSDRKLESLIDQAQQAQGRGDYRSAAAFYGEVLKLRPHSAETRTNVGIMYHLLNDYTTAASHFQLALRENPELFVPNLFLGLDLLELRDPAKALSYLQRAWRLNPHDERAALGLGQAYAAQREFQPANDWYSRAAEMSPKDPEALFGLGITYLSLQRAAASELGSKGQDSLYGKRLLAEFFEQEGRVNDAVSLYKKLLQTNLSWPGLETALGFDYVQQGQIAAAQAEFKAELVKNPGFLLAHLGLARIALEERDFEGCTQGLAKIWKIDRNFLHTNVSISWSGLAPDKASELAKHLSGSASAMLDGELRSFLTDRLAELKQEPLHASPPVSEGEATDAGQAASLGTTPRDLYQQGRYSLCTQRLKVGQARLDRNRLVLLAQCGYYSGEYRVSFLASGRVLTTNAGDLEALYWRTASASKLAVVTLLDAGLADPNSYRVHLLLADAYRSMNKYDIAETEYRKALALKPGDGAVRLGLATLYWQSKKYDEALPEIKEALAARPNDPEASYLMGDILVARRQYSEARSYVATALGASGKTAYYAHALLGKIYASEAQTDQAIKELQLALPGDDDGSFHFQIYQLYKTVGDQKAAAAALRESEAIRQRLATEMRVAIERSE